MNNSDLLSAYWQEKKKLDEQALIVQQLLDQLAGGEKLPERLWNSEHSKRGQGNTMMHCRLNRLNQND